MASSSIKPIRQLPNATNEKRPPPKKNKKIKYIYIYSGHKSHREKNALIMVKD
jgi:hypothetical protein